MATHAHIGIVDANNKITFVYCHWDGNPDHIGPILTEHYNTEEKINALMQLGDISVLGPEIGEKQDFYKPSTHNDNWCLAYGRDRNEPNSQARTCDFDKYGISYIDYTYAFIDGEWMCYGSGIPDWTVVSEILEGVK
jgi:hypothetical protein